MNSFTFGGKPTPQPSQVEVTNFPLDEQGSIKVNVVNLTASSGLLPIAEVPLCRVYTGRTEGGTWTTVINATPPTGKTWYVSKIRLLIKEYDTWDGQIEFTTKGITQLYSEAGVIRVISSGDVFDFEFPLAIKFTDTESIIVKTGAPGTSATIKTVLTVVGWEE